MIMRLANAMVRRSRAVILAVSCAVAAAAAVLGIGQDIEQGAESLRTAIYSRPASGEVVVVAVDERSIEHIQAWPWPRSTHGRLVERLSNAGVQRIAFDIDFTSPAADPKQDAAFARAIARSKAPVAMIGVYEAAKAGDPTAGMPSRTLAEQATTVTGIIELSDRNAAAIGLPFRQKIGGDSRRSLAVDLAGIDAEREAGIFAIDWSIRPETVPVYSYSDVLEGRIPAAALKGKKVLVGATAPTLGDRFVTPGHGRMPGVIVHAVGAETILKGLPRPIEPSPILLIAIVLVAVSLLPRSRWVTLSSLALSGAIVLDAAWWMREAAGISVEIAPGILCVISAFALQAIAGMAGAVMTQLTTDRTTSMPNFTAMQIDAPNGPSTVAIRLRNHLDTAAVLGQEGQAELLRRIRDRIRLAAGDGNIYQIDGHSFAWRTPLTGQTLTDAVEGLSAVFGRGIQIGDQVIDAPIVAGIVEDSSLDISQAVTAALLAAEHAARQGLPWTRHQDDIEEARWRTSVMSEVDRAIEAGEIWVAYQPKLDLRNGRVTGAEALVRWTHPERGPIRPDKFIPILEESGRIENLTMHVLETALRDFSTMGQDLTVAVNLSTRMLGRGRMPLAVRRLLKSHGFPAERLTFEITESAALTGEAGIRELNELRDIGVKISIDDYGTGQSTLTYLKKLPASELKVDQSFVKLVLTSRSDQVMIASTIALAHTLGIEVVAEGVETDEVLDALQNLDCDIIQGYHVGRPVPLAEFQEMVRKSEFTCAA